MENVVVIDYGTSNLRSVAKALEHVADGHARIQVTGDSKQILSADRIVFPGQGAIGQCMQHLQQLHLDACIRQCIDQKPFLGICLGLQSLMQHSDEDDGVTGLNIIQGNVVRFQTGDLDSNGAKYKIPHMGWNQVEQTTDHPLWQNIADGSRFYFVHSYYVVPDDSSVIAGTSSYINPFTAAVATGNLFACQFHPEKSQQTGLQLLRNFLLWNPWNLSQQ